MWRVSNTENKKVAELLPSLARKPLVISIPHSGEEIPPEAPWLSGLHETLLMFDVDRYVDQLYQPALEKLGLPYIKTQWHRYAVDLNRIPEDVDRDSVLGHPNESGKFPRGLHWRITTTGEVLLPQPMTMSLHEKLVLNYFEPFHAEVRALFSAYHAKGAKPVYHMDLHSMPSLGTSEHRDPGQLRADIVVSDLDGKSCSANFRDLVISSYKAAGFKVAYNWPYKGGRVTETYGHPALGQESIQVELNRALYMNEKTKKKESALIPAVQERLEHALTAVMAALPELPR
jgi:N-formylglutamate deformylase